MLETIILKGKTMFGIAALNAVFSNNPALSAIMIIMIVVSSQFATYQKMEQTQVEMIQTQVLVSQTGDQVTAMQMQINDMAYEESESLISKGFAGIVDTSGLVDKLDFWISNQWDTQLVAIDKLCNEPDRIRIVKLIGLSASTSICRAAR